jgi:hypothetical protein
MAMIEVEHVERAVDPVEAPASEQRCRFCVPEVRLAELNAREYAQLGVFVPDTFDRREVPVGVERGKHHVAAAVHVLLRRSADVAGIGPPRRCCNRAGSVVTEVDG